MFRSNCRAIFRLIFKQVECTIDKAFNLRDLILQELVNTILVCCNKNKLKVKIQMWFCCTISIKNRFKQGNFVICKRYISVIYDSGIEGLFFSWCYGLFLLLLL